MLLGLCPPRFLSVVRFCCVPSFDLCIQTSQTFGLYVLFACLWFRPFLGS
uniref:Uncharacterized protein n=1 Tax=Arundo donax TaxID=35708 RepID=A0A0A9FY16_ARUDO